MPWSQMISMNIRPPRPMAARRLDRLPAVNARIRKSWSRNIGSGDRTSIRQNTTSSATPSDRAPRTVGLSQPMVRPP